ncbi:ATP-dependent RNA helicase Dhx29-like protein [Lates japonicus]|uniref:ATP-dependent RNA helicase Dhx29-like protein n=1 Tax=Lates japonicus TaxID=270547 RepID=A0AAD3MIP3_LATJO|nr:ATP-dependent RNA helicase Dhx29-like protein [Lates japonicus]
MGGKKKKSAAPVAPAAAAAAAGRSGAAAAGNSVAEEPKKQPASNKPAKPAKENKSKGGNTCQYLANSPQTLFGFPDLYTALQKFNFKREHIEEAMKSSVLYGGDLHSALDWLCLNLKDEELPEGFRQQMQEESQRSRPRFQPAAQLRPAAQSPKAPINTRKETG